MSVDVIAAIIAGAAATLGVVASTIATGAIWRRRSYSPKNASALLDKGRAEEWNEVRILHPEWRPHLLGLQLTGVEIPNLNLRDAVIDGAVLAQSNLEGSTFQRCSAVRTDFRGAQLNDAIFDKADLTGAKFEGAALSRASFSDAKLTDATFPKDFVPIAAGPQLIIPQSLEDLDPRQLEDLVARVLASRGHDVSRTSHTHDAGYDLVTTLVDPLLGTQKILVEVKKYKPDKRVGVGVIRALLGSIILNEAQRGLIVTTGSFTRDARDVAERTGRLHLVDGSQLRQWTTVLQQNRE